MGKRLVAAVVIAATALVGVTTSSAGVGTSFPAGFAVPVDASLGSPVLGFGAAGPIARTPVILLHGNNDTPYPTGCNPYGDVAQLASYLLTTRGYAPSEVWALGYQGDQCDLLADQSRRSAEPHTAVANVPDLRAFVHAVLDYTGAKRVDIVSHSLGGVLARAWMRDDHAGHLVRRLVTIDSPHHGIVNCSPNPLNYWQIPALGGFTPDSAICRELGAADTPFLSWLNHGTETLGPTRYLAIRNADTSFVYFATQDGLIAPVPAEDRTGAPHDFSSSARLDGPLATNVDVSGQGAFDPILGTAHLGILASPAVWALTADFLLASNSEVGGPR
jgi:pimeloyl-ACP methyl ester carboxylesterase